MQYVNDWSLRKGDPPLIISNAPKLESTTIHNVVEESGDSNKTHIIVEADIARKDLSPLVQGHEVDGIPLCTPSVYADIGLTLGKYLLEKYQPQNKDNMVVVSEMDIKKALILRGDGSKQPIQAHAEADWLSNSVSIKFMSFDVSISCRYLTSILTPQRTRVASRNTPPVSSASKTEATNNPSSPKPPARSRRCKTSAPRSQPAKAPASTAPWPTA